MGQTAFVFPGQGSQEVGMLGDLLAVHEQVAETFAEASEVLGYDLRKLISEGPEEQLTQTEFTQPAILTSSVAIWRLFQSAGTSTPEVVAGHSLGEYSALVAASVIAFPDAVKLVQKRGQFMQTAVPVGEGSMAAILGLEDDQVIDICAYVSSDSEIVQAANFNAPGQLVIAGHARAVDQAIAACQDAGARRAMSLPVSAPFHSALMKPAAEKLSVELDAVTFSAPQIRVIQNVDADFHSDPDEIRKNLVVQMDSAVLWTNTIRRIAAENITETVECGPGKVLAGLAKRIDKSVKTIAANSVDSVAAAIEECV